MTDRRDEVVAVWSRHGGNVSATARELGLTRSTVQVHLRKAGVGQKPVAEGRVGELAVENRALPREGEIKRYILTSAQNNTHVHDTVWNNLLALAEHHGAEVLVGTYSYNTNAYGKLATKRGTTHVHQTELWFDRKLEPYIAAGDNRNIRLAPGLVWCGRANIIPTAPQPLSGYDTYTHRESGIFPHTRQHLRSVASAKYEPTKFNYTTGTTTKRNYIQKGAGIKAEHHHAYGGLVVEIDHEGRWYVRQLRADNRGRIYDLDVLVEAGEVTTGHRVEAVIWGDIHHAQIDPIVEQLAWEDGGMLDTLHPRFQFMHDVLDFHARSHHDRRNFHEMFERFVRGEDSVEDEIQAVADFLHKAGRKWCRTIVVNSNHDNAYERWLREADYKEDLVNAEFFLESQLRKVRAIKTRDDNFHAVEWACRRAKCPKRVRFLREDETFVICHDAHGGIECGMHGHLGAHGVKGSFTGLSRLGRKSIIGDKHQAVMLDGLSGSGTSSKRDLGYNTGPSAWSTSHVVTYKNGRQAIVTMWDSKWRA